MDDPLGMRVVDAVADLAGEVERAVDIERAVGLDDVLQRYSLHVLHHDEEHVLLLFSRGDGNDVGVADAREQPRLAEQLAEVEPLPVRYLDRDLLVDPGVLRKVNGTESAAPERREDFVLTERLAFEQHAEDG